MVTPLSRFFGRRKESRPAPAPDATPRYARRAILRSFGGGLIAVTLAVIMATGPNVSRVWAKPGNGNGVKAPKTMLPITVNEIVFEEGQLFALASVGNQQLDPIPLQLAARPNPNDADCPILNLEIGALHLNLLGLVVDTSDICLDITAHEGEGLLGDLLCGLSNLLSDGLPLGLFLSLLNADELEALLGGIADLLNEVFALATSPEAVQDAACDILNLALGPIDLNLLGLQVELDDCDDGPVTIDITAVPAGGLLGQLLCGLAGLLDGGIGGNALKTALNDVANAILDIVT